MKMTCYDCERTFSRSSIEMHEVPIEHKDKSGYRFVPVPICHECALRRFGIKCDHCGEFHEDVEAVFECKRDRPGLIPDGGTERYEMTVEEALFEFAAAWADLGEQVDVEPNRSVFEVYAQVWGAYDLQEADQVLEREGITRENGFDPYSVRVGGSDD